MLVTKITRGLTKVVDAENGIVSAVASTEAIDRDGDIIRAEGWDLGNFQRNPLLLSSHNYGSLLRAIGEWERLEVRGKRLMGHVRYYINEGNEEADWGFKLAQKGRAAYSVGFIPDMDKAKEREGRKGWEFRGQELLEISHVTVPSNPQALQVVRGLKNVHPILAQIMDEELADMEDIRPDADNDDTKPELHEQLRSLIREILGEELEKALGSRHDHKDHTVSLPQECWDITSLIAQGRP